MYSQVLNLNRCIEAYSRINSLSDNSLKKLYEDLLHEYNINKHLISSMKVVKPYWFIYIDSMFLPHLNYLRCILISRRVNID